jgi:hypothetical protein
VRSNARGCSAHSARGPYWKVLVIQLDCIYRIRSAGGTCVHDKVAMGVPLLLMASGRKGNKKSMNSCTTNDAGQNMKVRNAVIETNQR